MTEIRFAGYGGQGIIRSGIIIGKAASLFDDKFATMNQSFGPEARGGACSAQVIVSEARVLYPYVTVPHVLVAMSQEGYTKYEPELGTEGLLLIDEDLVKADPPRGKIEMLSIPATRFAEELGNRIIANVVMLGFFTAVTGVVSSRAMREAIPSLVPKRFVELNIRAFDRGHEFGQELMSRREKPAPKTPAQEVPAETKAAIQRPARKAPARKKTAGKRSAPKRTVKKKAAGKTSALRRTEKKKAAKK
jgi:2-oxoglutarate ferredoxin oxidoreductase subunit gamma